MIRISSIVWLRVNHLDFLIINDMQPMCCISFINESFVYIVIFLYICNICLKYLICIKYLKYINFPNNSQF